MKFYLTSLNAILQILLLNVLWQMNAASNRHKSWSVLFEDLFLIVFIKKILWHRGINLTFSHFKTTKSFKLQLSFTLLEAYAVQEGDV